MLLAKFIKSPNFFYNIFAFLSSPDMTGHSGQNFKKQNSFNFDHLINQAFICHISSLALRTCIVNQSLFSICCSTAYNPGCRQRYPSEVGHHAGGAEHREEHPRPSLHGDHLRRKHREHMGCWTSTLHTDRKRC